MITRLLLFFIMFAFLAAPASAGGDPDDAGDPGRFQEIVYKYLKSESGLEVMDRSVMVRPPERARIVVEDEVLDGWAGEVRAHAADAPGKTMEPRVYCYFIQHGRVKALAERGTAPWCPRQRN